MTEYPTQKSQILPVDQLIPDLKYNLAQYGSAVLTAEPGAGKTTRIPLALYQESWLENRRIIMLEPRRIAAISAARYMASVLGEQVGGTVGYRVALDSKVSSRTRIEVVTEGVLTRMLQHDPALEQVGLLIFDEFHERNLNADLGLAFALESRSLLREDLRILIMSATMDPKPIAQLLGEAPILTSTGRSYPVETYYEEGESVFTLYRKSRSAIEPHIAAVIWRALSRHEGDMLVFLPGVREIHRLQAELLSSTQPLLVQTDIVILHGGLQAEQQEQAVRTKTTGRRKIVLSTSLAESSVTVEGITIVVDSGLMRTRVFAPSTGMERLETRQVSLDAADQRRGRAGRQAPGVCYRLWSQEEHRILPESRVPDILQNDLASLALEVSRWGTDLQQMAWLTPPPLSSYKQGQLLLKQLDALDASGRITEHGQKIAALGVHPRLAHMIVHSAALGLLTQGCELAALLQERDILTSAGVDLIHRIHALNGTGRYPVHTATAERVRHWARRFEQQWNELKAADSGFSQPAAEWLTPEERSMIIAAPEQWAGLLLSLAYPDRIGQNRGDGRFLLRMGRGAYVAAGGDQNNQLSRSPYIAAAELDDTGKESRILLAAEVDEILLRRLHYAQLENRQEVEYDIKREAITARKVTRLGSIIFQAVNDPEPTIEAIQQATIRAIRQHGKGLELLNWTRQSYQLRQRIAVMHLLYPEEYPSMEEQSLLKEAESWLMPYLDGIRRLSDLKRLQAGELLGQRLNWNQKQEMDRLVPTHIAVPSGSRITVDYSDPDRPAIAVRLQEMFGCKTTPLIGGRLPITIHLLSPAHRPVQVTSDLESFWKHGYFEIKKDLKGRYPKHYWPDDPLAAQPTNRTKPRSD